jgi:hypothetical protein
MHKSPLRALIALLAVGISIPTRFFLGAWARVSCTPATPRGESFALIGAIRLAWRVPALPSAPS